MAHPLPDKNAIPGMPEAARALGQDLTILGLEPEITFEWKLAIYDAKIANNIEANHIGAVGRLVEFREAIIEEKFKLTAEYAAKKNDVLKTYEAKETEEYNKGNDAGLQRIRFEKYRRIFQMQEKFLAKNYPFKAHVKERLSRWKS